MNVSPGLQPLLMKLESALQENPQDLPEPYQSILSDMGRQLHDTFEAPAIAENFQSTPEQLLARAKELIA